MYPVGTIGITMYLDGKTSECGYTFVVTRNGSAWCAFRTARGFRYFLDQHGLTIDRRYTQLHDLREQGKGRYITTMCKNKVVRDLYFWSMREVPAAAKTHVGLVNGSYVTCYILDHGSYVDVYRPNPNAKDVYVPFDYWTMAKRIG